MTLESNSLFIFAIMVFIPSLIYIIIKRRHSKKVLLCFILIFTAIILMINYMFFPLNVGLEKSSIELVTPVKHDMTPFKYLVNAFQSNEIANTSISPTEKKELIETSILERNYIINSYILFFCLSCIASACVFTISNEKHKIRNLLMLFMLFIILDVLFIYTYYNASYALEGFDTSLFIFQIIGFGVGVGAGYILVSRILNKTEEQE